MSSLSAPAPSGEGSPDTTSTSEPLGAQIRQLRLEAGLTQTQLAARVGTTQAAIAHLEAGRRSPTIATLRKLAQALGQDLVLTLPCAHHDEDGSP